jgi:hypothetical protein
MVVMFMAEKWKGNQTDQLVWKWVLDSLRIWALSGAFGAGWFYSHKTLHPLGSFILTLVGIHHSMFFVVGLGSIYNGTGGCHTHHWLIPPPSLGAIQRIGILALLCPPMGLWV